MSLYRRRKTDGNHKSIGKTLRSVTVVIDVHELGRVGCDFIARHVVTKSPVFIEVKDPAQRADKRDRSKNEATMRDLFPGHWRMVLTSDDALRAVGL